MKFKSKLSKRQINSIFSVLVGFFLLIIDVDTSIQMVQIIGFLAIFLGVQVLYVESVRRYKIVNPYSKNHYDSKAEQKIANYFKRKDIIFKHHPEIKVNKFVWKITFPFWAVRLEPDFYLPEFDVFVEYWGLIDDPDYKKNQFDKKTKLYKDNAVDFISLYPKNLENFDWVFTTKLLNFIKEREGNNRKWR